MSIISNPTPGKDFVQAFERLKRLKRHNLVVNNRQKETDWNRKYGFSWTRVWSLQCVVEGGWVGLEGGGWVTVAQISYSGKLKSH